MGWRSHPCGYDSPPILSSNRWPIVFFSHGLSISMHLDLIRQLASAGCVVIAVSDHEDGSVFGKLLFKKKKTEHHQNNKKNIEKQTSIQLLNYFRCFQFWNLRHSRWKRNRNSLHLPTRWPERTWIVGTSWHPERTRAIAKFPQHTNQKKSCGDWKFKKICCGRLFKVCDRRVVWYYFVL